MAGFSRLRPRSQTISPRRSAQDDQPTKAEGDEEGRVKNTRDYGSLGPERRLEHFRSELGRIGQDLVECGKGKGRENIGPLLNQPVVGVGRVIQV